MSKNEIVRISSDEISVGVNLLLIIHDAVFWDVTRLVERFRGWFLFLLQESELGIEEESALFRQVSRRPLNCENVESRTARNSEMKLRLRVWQVSEVICKGVGTATLWSAL